MVFYIVLGVKRRRVAEGTYFDVKNGICEAFFESIGYGVLIHDSETVLYATKAASRIFEALDNKGIKGRKISELVAERYFKDYVNLVESVLAGERSPLFQGLARTVDGKEKWVEVCPNRVLYGQKEAVLLFVRDVTSEVVVKRSRSRIHELGLVQSVLSKVMSGDEDIHSVEESIFKYCEDLRIADMMCFVQVSRGRCDVRYVPNITPRRYGKCFMRNVRVIISLILDIPREVYIPNMFEFSSYGYSDVGCSFNAGSEISFFGVPLKVGGKVEGVIGFMKRGYNTFSAEDIAIARVLSGQISLSISLQKALRELAEEKERLYEIAMKDALTGVYTRLFFNNWMEEHQEMLKRRGEVSTCVLADIDNFKRINDAYGHLVGDEVLCRVAKTIRSSVRGMDLVVRYGGDEFLVVLPLVRKDEAGRIMERVVKNIGTLRDKFGFDIGISYGIASANANVSLVEALKKADELMYEMKRSKKLLA